MSWVRLDDDYIYHPKFRALSHHAFRLWHEGMCYCRKLMTDGLIKFTALKTFTYHSPKAVQELTAPCGRSEALWARDPDGYRVHDYLDWNPSHQEEAEERDASKRRMRAFRGKQKRPPVTPDVTPDVTPHVPGEGQGQNPESDQRKERVIITARSHRPIFTGTRFVVFEWQLDNINRLLGDKAYAAFGLDEFFHVLNARVDGEDVLVPQRDNGVWLLAEVAAEANRRGIPLVAAPVIGTQNKRIAGAIAGGNAFLNRGES